MAAITTEQLALNARYLLTASEKELEAGDVLQASEKLWGAARYALRYASGLRQWRNGKTYALTKAADSLAEELTDNRIVTGWKAAEKLHGNFYNDFLELAEVEREVPFVQYLVNKLLPDKGPLEFVDVPPESPS